MKPEIATVLLCLGFITLGFTAGVGANTFQNSTVGRKYKNLTYLVFATATITACYAAAVLLPSSAAWFLVIVGYSIAQKLVDHEKKQKGGKGDDVRSNCLVLGDT